MVRVAVVASFAALVLAGCVDRSLHDGVCDDGRPGRGELCFGDERLAIALPFDPLSVRVDDFDGDDDLDLVVLGTDDAGAVRGALVAGDGTGNFAPPQDAGVFGCSAYPVPGRFDDDGPADLLVDACDTSMLGFFGSASGVFAGPTEIEVGAITRTSGVVDLDDDGAGDIVVLGDPGDGSAVLNVVHARGSAFAPPVSLPLGAAAVGFAIGDVDGDGRPDAVLSLDGGTSSPLLATGRSDALGFAAPIVWDAIAPARGVALRDLDADAVPEALAREGDVLVVYAREDGRHRRVAATDLSGRADALLDAGALDGDERLDLVTYGVGSTVQLWLGDRDDGWTETDEIDLAVAVRQLVVADLDDDGAGDLVAGTFDDGTITIVLAQP